MDKLKNILEKIICESKQKEELFLSRDLVRKCNLSSTKDITNLKDLCYWLYINDKKEDCLLICSEVSIDFGDKKELYTCIRLIYALYARLLRENGKEGEAQLYTSKNITSYQPKLLKRLLNGELLYYDKIKNSEERGDEENTNTWRFSQFNYLCLMRELGGSEIYPVDKLENEMTEIKNTLNSFKNNYSLAITYDSSIEGYWGRIEKWLKENVSEILKYLQDGADNSEINNLEHNVNIKLPEDFIQFYKIHNGQIPYTRGLIDNEELLSIERIDEEWKIWKELIDSNTFDDINGAPDMGIKNDWYNKLWIPITYDGAGNHYCLDLNPTDEGNYGQVIRVWHDDSIRTIEANSFREWIRYFVEDLEAGRYVF
jgi:cell wall assembly regulator SMI1